jgi:hypothetical protein
MTPLDLLPWAAVMVVLFLFIYSEGRNRRRPPR